MDPHIDLLPRRLIFGNPERSIVRISHDGTRIAFLAPVDGILNLWVGPIERVEDARPVTRRPIAISRLGLCGCTTTSTSSSFAIRPVTKTGALGLSTSNLATSVL